MMGVMPTVGTIQKEGILKKLSKMWTSEAKTFTRLNTTPKKHEESAKKFSRKLNYQKPNREMRKFKEELPPRNADPTERAIQRGWCIKGFKEMCIKNGGDSAVSYFHRILIL